MNGFRQSLVQRSPHEIPHSFPPRPDFRTSTAASPDWCPPACGVSRFSRPATRLSSLPGVHGTCQAEFRGTTP